MVVNESLRKSRYDYDFIDYDLWLGLGFRFFFARCYFHILKINLLIWQMMFYWKTRAEKYGRFISANCSILISFYGYKLALQVRHCWKWEQFVGSLKKIFNSTFIKWPVSKCNLIYRYFFCSSNFMYILILILLINLSIFVNNCL